MAFSFDATYYLTARPDVFQAYVAAGGSTGLTWEQFAEQHYNTHGRFEGSNPNAVFNTNEYLAANPDVAAAGVNPFQHYLAHGVYEGRAPNATFPSAAEFDSAAYLAANPDLGAAGIDTPEEAYVHYVMHGQFENRPGTPAEDLTLTQGKDVLTGTSGDDVFNAPLGLVIYNDGPRYDPTLQSQDVLDGGAGSDTLIAELDGGTTNPTLTSIENLVLTAYDNSTLDLIRAEGVEKVTNTGSREWLDVINVGAGVDLELDNVRSGMSVEYDDIAVATQSIVANRVGAAGNTFTLNVDGVVNPDGAGEKFTLDSLTLEVSGGVYLNLNAPTDELIVSGTGALELSGNRTGLEVFDSTGYNEDRGLFIDLGDAQDLQSVATGDSHDHVRIFSGAMDGDLSVDLGAGENELRLNFGPGDKTAAINALDFTGGVENAQTLSFEAWNNSDFVMNAAAELDLDGVGDATSAINFQNRDAFSGELTDAIVNANADFAINNGPDQLEVNTFGFRVGGDFDVDGTVDLTVNASATGGGVGSAIQIGDINSATLESLTLNSGKGVTLNTVNDDENVLSALQTLTVNAAESAQVSIVANTADESDVNALQSVTVAAGRRAELKLQGEAGFQGTVQTQTITFGGPATAAGTVTVAVPGVGNVVVTVALAATAGDVATAVANALDGLSAYTAMAAGGVVTVSTVAVGPATPLTVNSAAAGITAAITPATGGVEPVDTFAGLEEVVVSSADNQNAVVDLDDISGNFTLDVTAVGDTANANVNVQNTAVTSVSIDAGQNIVGGSVIGGGSYGAADLTTVTASAGNNFAGMFTIENAANLETVELSAGNNLNNIQITNTGADTITATAGNDATVTLTNNTGAADVVVEAGNNATVTVNGTGVVSLTVSAGLDADALTQDADVTLNGAEDLEVLVVSAADAAEIDILGASDALTTVDVSAVSGLVEIYASTAIYDTLVTYVIGGSEADPAGAYDVLIEAETTGAREIFQFVEDFGVVHIDNFDLAPVTAADRDYLDLSALGVTNMANLSVVYDAVANETTITSAGGDFAGEIVLLGIDASAIDHNNIVFA